jgi:predicted nucleic acid-binding protein
VYTPDTNIIIYYFDYFDGEAPILAFLREQTEQGAPLFISAVTEHELYSYPHLTPVEVARIDALLITLTVIDVDSRIAQLSGQLRASYGIKALDRFIAATALMTSTTLATRNVRDFRRIPTLAIREL